MDKCYVITKMEEYLSEVLDYEPEFHVLRVFGNLDSAKKYLLKLSNVCSKYAESGVSEYVFWYKSPTRKIIVCLETINYMPD